MFRDKTIPRVRAVLDTNIVIDMLHFQDPRTARLKTAIDAGRVGCFSDAACLAELEHVVAYPEFRLDAAARSGLIEAYLAYLARPACPAHPEPGDGRDGDAAEARVPLPLARCRDPDDQKFLELAARCAADVLVTRDRQLLRLARHRLNPPPFAILTAEDAAGAFGL